MTYRSDSTRCWKAALFAAGCPWRRPELRRIHRDGVGFRERGWCDVVGPGHALPCIDLHQETSCGIACWRRFAGLGPVHITRASSLARWTARVERIHLPPQACRQIARPVRHVTHLALERGPFNIDGLLGDDFVDLERLQQGIS